MSKWIIGYTVGNTYKEKTILADTAEDAIRKARIKNIVYVIEFSEEEE